MNTSRILSGFDVEFQLGANWFFTALNLMNDHKLLGPPGVPIIISNVAISFKDEWDLEIDILGFGDPVFAKASLNTNGTALILTTSLPFIPPRTIPFSVLKNVAGTPELVKRKGNEEFESVLILLANLNIRAESQNDQPLPLGQHLERGDASAAWSFLPIGKDVAFGLSKETFDRFANNIWHTQLRASDGTHPLPDLDNKKGDWASVSMTPKNGKLHIKLEGDIPVDSPIIDIVPDPHVTITLILSPMVNNGKLSFSIESETDIDMSIWGNILGAIGGGLTGGILGFVIGLVTGGIMSVVLVGAGIGIVLGAIIIEIAEVIIEGEVQKVIKAKIDGEPLSEIHCCERGYVHLAQKSQDDGFNLSVLDSIPSSIAIHTANPVDEILYKQSLLVTSVFDDLIVDNHGFIVAGTSSTEEKFQPEKISINSFNYNGDDLISINYKRDDGKEQSLAIEEVYNRASQSELKGSFKIFTKPDGATLRLAEGKLACVCMKPVAIRQEDTIVQQIKFESGNSIEVPDAVALQNAAVINVVGYQLIKPLDYNAYYRAKPDFFKDNNFESLPVY
ncbi:MAG: hypothetical protein H0V30_01010 [Chitinophagaceae bacterium]|nr:hypothetical protein [Chitinophagaceae bacterium]